MRLFLKTLLHRLLGTGLISWWKYYVWNTNPKHYLQAGKHVELKAPLYVHANRVILESYTRLQRGVHILASKNQTVTIKKYTSITSGSIIVAGSHIPTVGVPQHLSYLYINDVDRDLVIAEDVWVGAGCILLSKADIGRGCVVGAGSLVTKPIPPYSVVAGVPAKIIAHRFSIDQILEHERKLYPAEERFSREELETIFQQHENLKVLGTDRISPEALALLHAEQAAIGMETYA